MADTITRGATVLHPTAVLGWPLQRPTRSVVHPILNTALVEVTIRPPGLQTGTLTTLWWDEPTMRAAYDALSTPGAPWVWAVPGVLSATLTAQVLEVSIETGEDSGRRWLIRANVQEVAS